jgi:tetratricopeptide (TPR) repeat protein
MAARGIPLRQNIRLPKQEIMLNHPSTGRWLTRILCVSAIYISTSITLLASGYFDLSPSCRSAYQKLISLRFAEARTEIDALKRSEPDNLIGPFLENYLECAIAMLDDDEKAYRRWVRQVDKRLDRISRGDRNSPYYLYTQAEIRLQWAVLRGRYSDYLTCISDVKQGYALLEENQRRFPDFVANKKSLALLHAVVGNVPDEIRWAVKGIGGMSGTIQQGTRELEEVLAYARANPDFMFGVESMVAYSYLMLHLNNNGDVAWRTLKNGLPDPKTNPIAAFALANVGMRTGHNDEAITLLTNCPSGGVYHPFPYKYFMLGIAKIYRLDTDANVPMEQFIRIYKGSFGVKEAWQKLAWCALLRGDQQGYWSNIYQAKIQGITRADTDKAADREANSSEMPDLRLLKARLLFDGGYYQRAYDELKNGGGNTYTNHRKHNLEYYYRMGRICQKLGRHSEAMQHYQTTIDGGSTDPWYFACNAALQLGCMHEERREWAKSRTAFQRCLKIQPKEYAASLHARAKAGINRVKGK